MIGQINTTDVLETLQELLEQIPEENKTANTIVYQTEMPKQGIKMMHVIKSSCSYGTDGSINNEQGTGANDFISRRLRRSHEKWSIFRILIINGEVVTILVQEYKPKQT